MNQVVINGITFTCKHSRPFKDYCYNEREGAYLYIRNDTSVAIYKTIEVHIPGDDFEALKTAFVIVSNVYNEFSDLLSKAKIYITKDYASVDYDKITMTFGKDYAKVEGYGVSLVMPFEVKVFKKLREFLIRTVKFLMSDEFKQLKKLVIKSSKVLNGEKEEEILTELGEKFIKEVIE